MAYVYTQNGTSDITSGASSGRMGINTSSPENPFEVAGNADYIKAVVSCYSTTAGHLAGLAMRRSHNGTIGTRSETSDGDVIGSLECWGVNSGSAFSQGARIDSSQRGSATANFVPADLRFYTSDGTAIPAERMCIREDGCVGIGCSDPQVLLDVADKSIRIRTSKTPASASAAGAQGQIA